MASVDSKVEFRSRVLQKLGNITETHLLPANDDLDAFIDEGLDLFNKIVPDEKTIELAGDSSTRRYNLTDNVAGWVNYTSLIIEIETVTDANTDDEKVTEVQEKKQRVHRHTDGKEYLYLSDVVATGSTLRIKFTVPWVVDDSVPANTTVPDTYTEALASLCASRGAQWIAAKASTLQHVGMDAEGYEWRRVRDSWEKRSMAFKEEAMEVIDPKGTSKSAGHSVEWKSDSRTFNRERISH